MLEVYYGCYQTIYIDNNIYWDSFRLSRYTNELDAQNSSLNHLLIHINNEYEAIKF